VVRKIAATDAERQRLAGEARLLTAATHPGVVRLIQVVGEDPPSELILARVEGGDVRSRLRELEWSEIAGLGAALATTVADLHHIGVFHRTIKAEHLLLDDGGRPVLCGFGESIRLQQGPEARSIGSEDVNAIVRLLLQLGDGNPPRCLGRVLRSSTDGRWIRGSIDARALARALVDAIPSARLPGSAPAALPSTGAKRDKHHRRPAALRRGVGIAIALAVGGSVVAARGALAQGGRGQAAVGCPPADGGCVGTRVVSGSVFDSPAGLVALVGPAGVEVNGRWGCGATALPAVLDVARGNVWVFDQWPTDPSGVPARLVETVPGAAGLRVLPGSDRVSSCDKLLVQRRRGPVVVIRPSRRSGDVSAEPAGPHGWPGSAGSTGSAGSAGSEGSAVHNPPGLGPQSRASASK